MMKKIAITRDMTAAIVGDLGQSPLFAGLRPGDLSAIAAHATMWRYDPGDGVMEADSVADSFFLVVVGEVIIQTRHPHRDEWIELTRIVPYETVGELNMILNTPRSVRVEASDEAVLLRFDGEFFSHMFATLPNFGLVTCRVLAKRLIAGTGGIPIPPADQTMKEPDDDVLKLLPIDFMQRHRVVPLRSKGKLLYLGCVEAPTPRLVLAVRHLMSGMIPRPVSIDLARYNALIQKASKVTASVSADREEREYASPELDILLRRMVAEGASDIHLTSRHFPRWRIDGLLYEMPETQCLAPEDIQTLIQPILPERNRAQFQSDHDTDLAYAIPGVARFRVNVFHDHNGMGAALRQIPESILSMEQLGLPAALQSLCDYPKGLILVTGPTGSGKSTTLASMIDYINNTRNAHVITLEDPIEFVHQSKRCLVNQREVGSHTSSFNRALRAALREDPDIVLVGEMRDLETVSLALETANTGHLVFGTLHTYTAVSTIARVIDMFPAGQQNQIRSILADTLKGVIAQTLCRRIGGGRIAALEIMVSDLGIAALIREGKTHQVLSAMQTAKARGNRLLNEELKRLVQQKIATAEEVLSKTVDKTDLMDKLGLKPQAFGAASAAAEPRDDLSERT